MLKIDGNPVTLDVFCSAMDRPTKLDISNAVIAKIDKIHAIVLEHASGDTPVYGLNTGLGGNLGYRIKPEEIADFQTQIIAGRAVACGKPLPENIGRGILLYRILSAAHGFSGISSELFQYLCAVYEAGISPVIPEYGSIGDSDLVQNAYFGLAVLGQEHAEAWLNGEITNAADALQKAGLTPPALQPKEGLAMVSHSGLTVTLAATALKEARLSIDMAKSSIVLSYEGYGANQNILDERLYKLRPASGHMEAAKWFRENLKGSEIKPRRIQEALSFRTIASVIGTAEHALQSAISIWQDEVNGSSDSPVILDSGEMLSAVNFHSPALALALETLSLSLVSVANGSVQRMHRMMDDNLTGLPKRLSPIGGASAGFIPSQKTASVLLSEIRHCANPVIFDPAPMSDSVEDMASMTPLAANKLARALHPFKLLTGLEALIASQAIDLRKPKSTSVLTSRLHKAIRAEIPMLIEDRGMAQGINKATQILASALNPHAE